MITKATTIIAATTLGAGAFLLGTRLLQYEEPLLFVAGIVVSIGGVMLILFAGTILEEDNV